MQIVAPPKKGSKYARSPRAARGVALIFVLTTIAILTAIGMDFAYQSRVNFELAVQSRDSLRARSLAMSGMNLSRYLLHMQGQIDQVTSQYGAIVSNLVKSLPIPVSTERLIELCSLPPQVISIPSCLAGVNPPPLTGTGSTAATNTLAAGTTAAAGAKGATPAGTSVIQLWKISEKMTSNTIFNFINAFPTDKKTGQVSTPHPDSSSKSVPIEANFGEFTGTFEMKITDEDQKINVQRLSNSATTGLPLMTTMELKGLWDNPKWDFLFNEEDHNKEKVSRNDILIALLDWSDPTQLGHTYDPTLMTGTPPPFTPGGGDKNGPYSRYKPRYKVKDAHFDSLEELHMVRGISDNFMLAFGDRLTVYSSYNGKINPNTNDLSQLAADILAVVDPKDAMVPALQSPVLALIVQEQMNLYKKYLPFIGMPPGDFISMLATDGVPISKAALQTALSGTSSTFKIVSTGYAGRVKKTLTAIVQYDSGMGQLLYWHEE